jgi:predicted Zn-dependent peptidase
MASGNSPPTKHALAPVVIVVTGDVEQEQTFAALETAFGNLPAAAGKRAKPAEREDSDIAVNLETPVAQAQLGYLVPAPGPGEEASRAYRILLYILSHDYEGRLGKEAISNRGLAYYIDSRYRSDGENGWVTLAVGVDPEKLEPLKELLQAELRRLHDDLPTREEVEEAKRHLVGRARSAAQSNRELAASLAGNWIWYGATVTPGSLARELEGISRQDVIDIVPAFTGGVTVVVGHW